MCKLIRLSFWSFPHLWLSGDMACDVRPRLDALQKLKFFHTLSITSIFGPIHEVVNIGKKITNYTV
jgi:hypothetical protein